MSFEQVVIKAEGLGKCYEVYAKPSDRLKQFLMPRVRKLLGRPAFSYFREFWALHGVTFEIARGETVGIVGRNGSGKSTLLQIVCGTLTPTSGSVETNGRVAALLELGSGFNVEYTGRENVYMNCAVLGLTRAQIDSRFESIVAFSEIGAFIDQPVKNYSSGMFARLAFAAAIHVDPDIMVVDEALSVGDFAFQLKCIRRLKELAEKGCTVLFVTHDIEQVQKLCRRALYLRAGEAVFFGDAGEACERYLADVRIGTETAVQGQAAVAATPAVGDRAAAYEIFQQHVQAFRKGNRRQGRILHVMVNGHDITEPSIAFGATIDVQIVFRLDEKMEAPTLALYVTDETGQMIVGTNSTNENAGLAAVQTGRDVCWSLSFENRLREGRFGVQVFLADVTMGMQTDYADYLELAVPFRSVARDGMPRWAWITPHFTSRLEPVAGAVL